MRVAYIIIPLSIWIAFIGVKKSFSLYIPLLFLGVLGLYLYYGGWLQKELNGVAHIHIEKLSYQSSFFGSNWVYSGVVKKMEVEGRQYRHLPFTLYRRAKWGPLDASKDYKVKGTLKKKETYGYALKVLPEAVFTPIEGSFSWAQKRYELKKRFKSFLKKRIPFRSAREFLVGISTGDFSNAYLSYTFSRFGLNHLLAISGFHFGLLLIFLNTLLRFLLPIKIKNFFVAIGLCLFYVFVGSGPSLSRAWMVALVYLGGSLFEKRASALNTLSLSLVWVLLFDPLMLSHLGFQFSFLVTYAILIYTPKMNALLQAWIHPKTVLQTWTIKSLGLGLSVHLAALPLTLFYFHKFYLLSLFYNLFIPSLVGFFIFALLTGLILYLLLPALAHSLLYWNGWMTEQMLKGLYWIPTSFDVCIRVPCFPLPICLTYLSVFLVLGAVQQKNQRDAPLFLYQTDRI